VAREFRAVRRAPRASDRAERLPGRRTTGQINTRHSFMRRERRRRVGAAREHVHDARRRSTRREDLAQ